ncbi:MAG: LysR family transcriptional regulator [Tissierellia bacterium]|nr:LysR family transcriptional regulator [Tissierellia bacterium]
MNLKNLQYYVEVCEERSFTKASENLYLSQSTLSKAIKNLEDELGYVLIDRSSKHFQLTDKGMILYESGGKLLHQIKKSVKIIKDELSNSKGKLVIGIPPVISTVYFSQIVYQFKQDYPDIELHVIEAGAHTLNKLLEDNRLDMAILITPLEEGKYFKQVVASDEAVLLVNKDHPLAMTPEISFSELKGERFILLDETYMIHHQIVKKAHDAGFEPNIIGKSTQWDYICELVGNDFGVTILPRPILHRFHLDNIRVIPFAQGFFPWNIVMCTCKRRQCTEVMNIFWDYVPKHIPHP